LRHFGWLFVFEISPISVAAYEAPKAYQTGRAAAQGVLHEQIGLRAYHIWLASDGAHGNDFQHWFQAEKEMRASASIADPRNSQEEPNTQIEP
jgi:hypothetical protein